MQKLQLYIATERIDLFKDEQVSLNLSQQDVKDPKKIFTEFSKTFTIPASSTNNKIFDHYYNFDIINGFDARDKVEASIELNNIPYKEGFVALNGVQLKNNKAYAYKITFYGKTINLTKTFGEDDLTILSGVLDSTYALDYTAANIQAKLQATIGDVIIAPLITHTEQLYYDSGTHVVEDGNVFYNPGVGHSHGVMWDELKFAIKIDTVVAAIATHYGLTFSDDFFSNATNYQFNTLYLWMHRKKGKVEPSQQTTSYATQVNGFTLTSSSGNSGATIMSGGTTLEIIPGSENLTTNELELNVNAAYTAILYSVRLYQNGSLWWTSSEAANDRTLDNSDFGFLPVGTYYIEIVTATALTFDNVMWNLAGAVQLPSNPTSWTAVYETGTFNATAVFQFTPSGQLPTIKVIDFMNGLFSMFNLTAFYDNQKLLVNGSVNPDYGNIKIQTLDSFYANNFNTWDVSQYIIIDKSEANVGLPYNEISFGYEGIETLLAQTYTQEQSMAWGALSYSGGTRLTGPNTSYTISLPFEHMQYERLVDQDNNAQTTIQYGRFVDDNQDSYLGKPLIFYPLKQTSATTISFLTTATNHIPLTTYIIPSNTRTLSPTGIGMSTDSINFNDDINEYTGASGFTGTLFNNYYTTYITDVFNTKRRIIKVSAFLPLKIVYKLQMNDVITINNQNYNINSASINLITGKTNFELLNKV